VADGRRHVLRDQPDRHLLTVGQRLVVIGGSSGIGLAVARKALEAGWDVTIASRDPGRAPLDVAKITLDVTDIRAVRTTFSSLGPIDHLVSTATAHALGSVRELDLDAGRHAFEAKIFGPLAAIQSTEISSSIVLTSGLAATTPNVGAFFLSPVNAAVEGAVRGLARGLAPVRVNAVAPGVIDTPRLSGIPAEARQEWFDQLSATLPAGRVGLADDVAEGIWHLMNNEFLTGTVLRIDGGARLVGP
jgi:NAD(P)-dependent dehydrogenase (short-subunit alcohol dehydrogenase family)